MNAPTMMVSTLSNGFRVASQENFGQISTLALFVDGGSMYESNAQLGACNFLEAAAFSSTSNRSAQEVQQYAQTFGITTQAVFNREVMMYKVDVLRSDVNAAMELMADAALRPAFSDADLAAARHVIRAQRDDVLSQPQVCTMDCRFLLQLALVFYCCCFST
jgi:predicted Zn-dependent peptidase